MNIFRWFAFNYLMVPCKGTSEAGDAPIDISDHDLIKACQSGDASAFESLVTRHRGTVYAMVQNMIRNDADAWDLSQEVFIKVWKALPRFEARAKFSTWLYRVVHNAVYDWLRKRKVDTVGEFDDSILSEGNAAAGSTTTPSRPFRPDEAMEYSELGLQINSALATLSSEHRETILLREVQGFDYKEIAKAMDCSLGTVMSRLYYAREKLQTQLKNETGKN